MSADAILTSLMLMVLLGILRPGNDNGSASDAFHRLGRGLR